MFRAGVLEVLAEPTEALERNGRLRLDRGVGSSDGSNDGSGGDGGSGGDDKQFAKFLGITALVTSTIVGGHVISAALEDRRRAQALARLKELQRAEADYWTPRRLEALIDQRVQVKVDEHLDEIRKRADAAERGRDLRARSREQDRDGWAREGEQQRWRRATEAENQAAAREHQRDERAARWDLEAAERERQRDARAAEAEQRRAQSAATMEQARAETSSQTVAQFYRDLQRKQAEFDAQCQAQMREFEESMRAFTGRWSTPLPGPPAAPGSVSDRMKKLYDDNDD